MTNKDFTKLLKQEIEHVLEIINTETLARNKELFGNFVFADHVTTKNYADLTALYNIMKKFPNLTTEQIEFFIKGKQSFKFLEKFINIVPNALEELKDWGSIKMAEKYSELYFRSKYRRTSKNKLPINDGFGNTI